MNKHTVFVAGKRFILLSEDKPAYVEKLAKEVDEAITKIALDNPTLDRRAAAILCALDYADDKNKEIARTKSVSDNAQPLIAQADRQARQLREMKEQLIAKDNEIKKLRDELKSVKDAFAKSTQILDGPGMTLKVEPPVKNEHQNKKNKHKKGYTPNRQYSLFELENNE